MENTRLGENARVREEITREKGPPNIIHAENLGKRFRDTYAVQALNFYVPQGAIFGFIGPSGSGKTTTIRLLTGVLRPSEGSAVVLGKNPYKFTKVDRENIGYLPQSFILFPNLTVWENMNFVASLYGTGLMRGKRLKSLLEFVELGGDRGKLASQLSGGMQRRLGLAATLIHDPSLIFLDEPTAGIDPILRAKFWEHFGEMKQAGHTLFITTQYVGEAEYCDIVGVMSGGKMVAIGTPDGLRKRAFGGAMVVLRSSDWISNNIKLMLEELPFVSGEIHRTGDNELSIVVDEASTAIPQLLEWASQNNITVESVEESIPNLDEVFVKIIEANQND